MRTRQVLTLLLVFVLGAGAALLAARFAPTRALAANTPSLPPDEDHAKAALETSPRHGELIDIPVAGGTPIHAWVSYPERKDKAGVVIVVHEIFGLSDWIRSVADQLAKEGFIAVVPDLITGLGPGGGGTESVASRDDVVKLVRSLTPEMTTARLDAVHDWAVKQPAANGRTATMGFCWGGGQSFAYATSQPALAGAVVFYGVAPDSAALLHLHAPVIAHYGGDDERVDATIAPAQAQIRAEHGSFEPHVYDGAGHGFLRQQPMRDGANLRASQQAWPASIAFLKKVLKSR